MKMEYIYTSTLMNFKRIFTFDNFIMSTLFVTIPLLSFGIVVGGYLLISPVLYLFIWGIVCLFITTKSNEKNTYLDKINNSETSKMKLYKWFTFYFISLVWVMIFSMLCLTLLFFLYRPGGLFHSSLFNSTNSSGLFISEFWYFNFIYSIIIQFSVYYLLADLIHKFVSDNKNFMILIIGIAMFSLTCQSMFDFPVRVTTRDSLIVIDEKWMKGTSIQRFFTFINPQTHIGNFQQTLLYQVAYSLTETGEKVYHTHIIDINILTIANDLRWNLTIIIPLIYILALLILNLILSI